MRRPRRTGKRHAGAPATPKRKHFEDLELPVAFALAEQGQSVNAKLGGAKSHLEIPGQRLLDRPRIGERVGQGEMRAKLVEDVG